jgi:hypothetical protein
MQGVTRKLAVLAISVLPTLAFAGGVKAGLWEVEMEGMDVGLPPEQAEAMKKAGIDMSKMFKAMKPQFCLTEEQAKMDKPPQDKTSKDCKVDSWDKSGSKMKGHMTCDGDFKGTIDMTADFKSDTEYASEVKTNGTSRGHASNMTMKSTSHWLSNDCGKVKPYEVKS